MALRFVSCPRGEQDGRDLLWVLNSAPEQFPHRNQHGETAERKLCRWMQLEKVWYEVSLVWDHVNATSSAFKQSFPPLALCVHTSLCKKIRVFRKRRTIITQSLQETLSLWLHIWLKLLPVMQQPKAHPQDVRREELPPPSASSVQKLLFLGLVFWWTSKWSSHCVWTYLPELTLRRLCEHAAKDAGASGSVPFGGSTKPVFDFLKLAANCTLPWWVMLQYWRKVFQHRTSMISEIPWICLSWLGRAWANLSFQLWAFVIPFR